VFEGMHKNVLYFILQIKKINEDFSAKNLILRNLPENSSEVLFCWKIKIPTINCKIQTQQNNPQGHHYVLDSHSERINFIIFIPPLMIVPSLSNK